MVLEQYFERVIKNGRTRMRLASVSENHKVIRIILVNENPLAILRASAIALQCKVSGFS
jgi:hypothetical protein